MAQQYFFPFAFPERQERDDTRQATIDICRSAGFMSSHQKSLLSPPTMLKFITAHAKSFGYWVQATRIDAAKTRRALEEIIVATQEVESCRAHEFVGPGAGWCRWCGEEGKETA